MYPIDKSINQFFTYPDYFKEVTTMEISYIKALETIIVVIVFIIAKKASSKLIQKTIENKLLHSSRERIVKKSIKLILSFILIVVIFTIWGVHQSDLVVFIGSFLTVVGVAFFAQWSILSNITSSVIIFFNHSIKLDDEIIIMEGKEYEIEGTVSNIGLFFITIRMKNDEELTLPNNIFIQKMIKRKTGTDETIP
ncbi:mechanosensitive ion channel family protein [Aquimarina sp. ERC-38]|uniref:mechanosensitive ion channel domain-containing protein n=1 Tax=Aquimarina sp. ERC-38 TaxID=2949996 RepID=UPI002247037F|nr:mechanosensitive ion channel domain-containing protein [Aquimarina sp. ERC-38]UZO80366.1 mechanosensitive ion channel family protein [Aquimarina sp. ERC-38]